MAFQSLKNATKMYLPETVYTSLRILNQRFRDRVTGHERFVKFNSDTITRDVPLIAYLQLLTNFDDRNPVALDKAHNLFVVGLILATKPKRILELGIGSGFLTSSIIYALQYNRLGTLTSVDNWFDTYGVEPHLVTELRKAGVDCVVSGEEEYVRNAPTNHFDILISDGDHYNSPKWLDQHLRIVRPQGILLFHDTNNNSMFPALSSIEPALIELGLWCYHFTANSRHGERCDRGLLFAINRK
jgi:predicted O-methyltransferase YrrM